MTIVDRLREAGAPENEVRRAATAIAELLPLDRNVRVTDDVLDAARAGNLALVSMLLAEEVDAESDEIEAILAIEHDARSVSADELRARLGL